MCAFQRKIAKQDSAASPLYSGSPSETLRIAVTFNRPNGEPGLTKFNAPLSTAAVKHFVPDPVAVDRGIYELSKHGFTVTTRGKMSVSVTGKREDFERAFGTRLERFDVDRKQPYTFHSFYFPPQGAPWAPAPELKNAIDDAYIQWPHIYMATPELVPQHVPQHRKKRSTSGLPSPKPPLVNYFHLDVPDGVASYINASRVHAAGTTGKGVRVVMVDSGFGHTLHPFFAANGYRSSVDLAPGATNDKTDPNGHGTGESANVFAVAPGATFIGVKVDHDGAPNGGASMLEGFQTALQHNPQVISISMGYDLRDEITRRQLSELPNNLAALEAEVQAAVASGIVVVFSAGNGHFSFPGMLPDVISAGGTFVDEDGNSEASDYASAFDSKIYAGRHVPDFCGLVGLQPHASYIMLPIPKGCEIDHETSVPPPPDPDPGDGTAVDDGWGVFSGTSAAAPQLAGVCALLLEKNPSLTPSDIKAILRRTARDVLVGKSNSASSDDGVPMHAGPGDDGSTGAGLVDAYAAWQQV
jgi:subtilisin family serine protease